MKIAIWGLGVSGLGALKYLSREKKHEIYLINQGEVENWYKNDVKDLISIEKCYSQEQCESLATEVNLIIISPGIDPRIEKLKPFSNVKKVCDVEYVSQFIEQPIIGITGTNGKTSTVTMIYDVLTKAELNVFVGGNIGISPFEAMEKISEYDAFVFELSSFQLELMDTFRPRIAAILNISKSHMERYDEFTDYLRAKLNITTNQGSDDILLLSEDLLSAESNAKKVKIDSLEGYDFSQAKVLGEHMKENFFVANEVLRYFKVDNHEALMQDFIESFSGVKYRLQYLGTLKGVDFYNDAKSTNTNSTMAALSAFGRKNVALILGGKLRDETQDFVPGLKSAECQVSLFLFGESRDYLREQLEDSFKVVVKEKLDDVVDNIVLSEFDVVLFSPGFPSFDQYDNYIKRGDHFQEIVEKLF